MFLQWQFRAQPPNLIPANISGYTVCIYYVSVSILVYVHACPPAFVSGLVEALYVAVKFQLVVSSPFLSIT